MSNVIAEVTARIEEYRTTNKKPCKSYATEAAAEKAVSQVAQMAADHFAKDRSQPARSARYVVFYIQAWGRWVGAVDMSELIARSSSTGGYLGIVGREGFFTY